MFNILSNMTEIDGRSALDLYAGTGGVGFEALSRGARRAVFVEADRKTAAVLRNNAINLGVDDRCDILITKVELYLTECEEKFDMIFVDPPYAINETTGQIIDEILSRNILNRAGIICVEHSNGYVPPSSIVFRQRHFGSTILSFIKPEMK